ncbi:molybdate ABC transporter substrate-binding protein [Ammoniphilus resinae]|uniref:Molybdate transport system substrate-binding protein n=1 Tax=Ammoniphilus resinae TaxID=861532 RepID=A0ABS4GR45_9BACL|nr:molybdate ABC transporter substrate-binding protein [Ammoniphilus resinae]MBP1932721.1 molybdate transport system substrate-binding protein [Ammoniphilus resinae]
MQERKIHIFHADSLTGPMNDLKESFQQNHFNTEIILHAGRSKELAEQILAGERCDVFAASDPKVMETLLGRRIADQEKEAVSWHVSFSANEMVLISRKGCEIKSLKDLLHPEIRFARVTGGKDLASARTIRFLELAAKWENDDPGAAQYLIDHTKIEAATIPDCLSAVTNGQADAAVVYRSAALTVEKDVRVLSFPSSVNLSDQIRNVLTVPGTAENSLGAYEFVQFILSTQGKSILERCGQPPLNPPVIYGELPFVISAG